MLRTVSFPREAALSTSINGTKVSPNEVRLIVAFSSAAQISSRSSGVMILPAIESATGVKSSMLVFKPDDLTHSLHLALHFFTRPRWLYTSLGYDISALVE